MKSIIFMILLSFTLISCDEDEKTDLESKNEPVCGLEKAMVFGKCMNVMDWKIELKNAVYPYGIAVFVNEAQVFTECSGDLGLATINRTSFYPMITIPEFHIVKETQTINFKITECISGAVKYMNPVQNVKNLPDGRRKYVYIAI
jgi:hypothetical protein